VVPVRDSVGGNFFFRFHYSLHLPRTLGIWLVGLAAMAMLVALVSGIVIHRHSTGFPAGSCRRRRRRAPVP